MSVNINLADRRNPNQAKKERVKKIRAIAVALLLITAFSAVIIFILDYRFSASYLRGQEQELKDELNPYSQASTKLFIVNSKLADITSLLNNRKNYSETVKLAMPEVDDIEIEEFTVSDKGIEMVFTASSLTFIDDYLNSLIALSNEGVVNSVTLNSLNTRNNNYEVDLTILL